MKITNQNSIYKNEIIDAYAQQNKQAKSVQFKDYSHVEQESLVEVTVDNPSR